MTRGGVKATGATGLDTPVLLAVNVGRFSDYTAPGEAGTVVAEVNG